MKKILLFGIILTFFACNTTKKAQRKLRKIQLSHPELFQADTITTINTKTDTVYFWTPESTKDSTFTWEEFEWNLESQTDTATLSNQVFETRVILLNETFIK